MRIAVTGGTGFIGRALVSSLTARNHEVLVLSRSAEAKLPGRARLVEGDPRRPGPWQKELGDVDAAIHLAGENVVGRWTDAKKRAITESRVEGTRHVVDALLAGRARCLISGSAIGYYGSRGDEPLDEQAQAGDDFLASLCHDWEAEAHRFAEAADGVSRRLVVVRTGVVLGKDGGPLAKMLPAFRAFAGGPVGDGRQWVSWIHLADQVALLEWALDDPRASGAINATAPSPVTMKELARAIGAQLGRPSRLAVPAFALRLLFGEGASVLLDGQRVVPSRALELGFAFRFPTLQAALADLL